MRLAAYYLGAIAIGTAIAFTWGLWLGVPVMGVLFWALVEYGDFL